MDKTIKWAKVKHLSAPAGFTENIGVSNMLCGILDNKLILGGGANFPYEHPLKNGERVEHRSLYLIRPVENTFHIIDTTILEKPVADGKTVIFNNIMFFIGGNRILKINIINNKLHVSEYFELPFTIKNCVAEQLDGIIYYGLGTIDGKLTNKFFAFNIFTKENVEISSFPSYPREQAVCTLFKDEIVIFSGGGKIAYTDGYKYNIKKKMWQTLSDVEINNEKISLLAGGHTKINDNELLVIGGFNEKIWNYASNNFATLKDEEKQKFREFYFSQELEYYNWNKEMLIYNYLTDSWKTVGQISFEAPCGNSLIFINDNLYSIMGEIKPGTRTPNIYRLAIENLFTKPLF